MSCLNIFFTNNAIQVTIFQIKIFLDRNPSLGKMSNLLNDYFKSTCLYSKLCGILFWSVSNYKTTNYSGKKNIKQIENGKSNKITRKKTTNLGQK